MALSATNKSNNQSKTTKEQPRKGSHLARVVGLVDLGHQPSWEYEGKTIKDAFKIRVTYELVSSKMEDGRPFHVSEDINVTWYNGDGIQSGLTKRVLAIDVENETQDGKDLGKLVGKPCMVTIDHRKNGYAKIANVSPVPEGIPVPGLINSSYIFDIDNPDMAVYNSLPDFIKTRIQEALNYPTSALAAQVKAMEL